MMKEVLLLITTELDKNKAKIIATSLIEKKFNSSSNFFTDSLLSVKEFEMFLWYTCSLFKYSESDSVVILNGIVHAIQVEAVFAMIVVIDIVVCV